MATVIFVDETTSGVRRDAWRLAVAEERLTLRELLRRRVHQEVAEHNARGPEVFHGLVQPTRAERTLNGYRRPVEDGPVDPERQFLSAVEAFGRNGFLVLVGDRQVEDLDAELDLRTDTEVCFLKLVPLVGG
ncbi:MULTISPECIES: hypothetical protein [Kitasatospora]|uniref:PIN domain-containing protein n=1 Tax=Kitasatospora cathayae TaxID=3004092 RepID=A0ABY7PYA0_9ACTN|nr:hypothetical protein [Kitasatospora sp. HUAS 3-15]WBP85408.1 hypothetical protein O1G21_05740 [Kitasatospora sp. HUAS 3-15]